MTTPTYTTAPRHTAYAERRWRRIPLGWTITVNHGNGGKAWRPTLHLAMRWAAIRHVRIDLGRRTGAGRLAVILFRTGMLALIASIGWSLAGHDVDNAVRWSYLLIGWAAMVAGEDRLGAA